MNEAIKHFRDSYAQKFEQGVSGFLRPHGQDVISRIQQACTQPRSTIYIFGNGGSHAIGKCLEYALQTYALSEGIPLRVRTGIDVHQIALLGAQDGIGVPFIRQLKLEAADSRDLVILISGSGSSDNLCEVAYYTAHQSIPTLALIGSERGRLRDIVRASDCLYVPFEDQQISEDVTQSITYFVSRSVSGLEPSEWNDLVSYQAQQLSQLIKNIPERFLVSVADATVNTFHNDKPVWVLGFDHPALSACAEHTAHNLYWDSIYQVGNPPRRRIWSSPTGCDFSGISNDRTKQIFASLTDLRDSEENGIALIYSMISDNSELRDVVEKFAALKIPRFLFTTKCPLPMDSKEVKIHETGLTNPHLQAIISQIFGHMVGRIIRMRLLQEQDFTLDQKLDSANFLINFDLAQRRLLHDRGGN